MKTIRKFATFMLFGSSAFAQETKSGNRKTEADYYWDSRPVAMYKTIDRSGKETNVYLPGKLRDHQTGTDLAYFKNINNPESFSRNKKMEEKYSTIVFSELQRRYFREWGIHFWKNFPDDPRRFEWLRETVIAAPLYLSQVDGMMKADFWLSDYGTVEIDNTAMRKWKMLYEEYLKEFFISPGVSARDKRLIYFTSLKDDLLNWRKQAAADKFDYEGWLNKVRIYDLWAKNESAVADRNLSVECLSVEVSLLLQNRRIFGFTENDLNNCIKMLEKSGIPSFIKAAREFQNPPMVKLLEKRPLIFNTKSACGKSVEIKDFKGKLVYVDFWSIGCGGCISSMPELKRIYKKYKNYGLEVISACFVEGKRDNGAEWFANEEERIMHVHEKLGGDWPLILLKKEPGQKEHRIRTDYGFYGNPNLFLFDEDGKLLKYQGELLYNPEAVIRDYLIARGKIKQ